MVQGIHYIPGEAVINDNDQIIGTLDHAAQFHPIRVNGQVVMMQYPSGRIIRTNPDLVMHQYSVIRQRENSLVEITTSRTPSNDK